jgi:hypothetical protein
VAGTASGGGLGGGLGGSGGGDGLGGGGLGGGTHSTVSDETLHADVMYGTFEIMRLVSPG